MTDPIMLVELGRKYSMDNNDFAEAYKALESQLLTIKSFISLDNPLLKIEYKENLSYTGWPNTYRIFTIINMYVNDTDRAILQLHPRLLSEVYRKLIILYNPDIKQCRAYFSSN